VVKSIDAAEVRIVVAAVRGAASDAVLVAKPPFKFNGRVFAACMSAISREFIALA
jgi:hypothetical protein